MEGTRGIANVGRKYAILSGTLPIDFLMCNPNRSQEASTPLIEIITPGLCCLKLINDRVFTLDFKAQYLEQSEDKNISFADQLNQ